MIKRYDFYDDDGDQLDLSVYIAEAENGDYCLTEDVTVLEKELSELKEENNALSVSIRKVTDERDELREKLDETLDELLSQYGEQMKQRHKAYFEKMLSQLKKDQPDTEKINSELDQMARESNYKSKMSEYEAGSAIMGCQPKEKS